MGIAAMLRPVNSEFPGPVAELGLSNRTPGRPQRPQIAVVFGPFGLLRRAGRCCRETAFDLILVTFGLAISGTATPATFRPNLAGTNPHPEIRPNEPAQGSR